MVPFSLPPPPPPPDLAVATSNTTTPSSHSNLTRTILTITFLLLFVLLSILAIHLLLGFLSRRRRNRVSHSPSPNPLLASLPLVSLPASSKSPLDCAVCLSPFLPSDALRLLPACRHAFHASCVDVWLSSTPSCPLCRAPVEIGSQRSDSVRLELGSVSRRLVTPGRSTSGRSYSIGSELEYVVDDEVEIEAVVAAVAAHVRRESEGKEDEVGGSGRGWLREYVDRLASSASSSFRCSGRWSRRSDAGVIASGSWDLEGNAELAPYFSFYRWLVGV